MQETNEVVMKLTDGQTIVFTGDSITDCGRVRPLGYRAGLGSGYVALVDAWLAASVPGTRIRVFNTGIGGNRVTDLAARWNEDVVALKPDWVSVLIGINDVWRQFDDPQSDGQVTIDTFTSTYRGLLERTRPAMAGMVLMTPFYLEVHREDPMRSMMDAYGAVVQRLAGEFDAVFVDLQEAFDVFMDHRPTQSLCGDRVHPNLPGHAVIARAFLQSVGMSMPR
jgi:lysophospholipase L1-like esterase